MYSINEQTIREAIKRNAAGESWQRICNDMGLPITKDYLRQVCNRYANHGTLPAFGRYRKTLKPEQIKLAIEQGMGIADMVHHFGIRHEKILALANAYEIRIPKKRNTKGRPKDCQAVTVEQVQMLLDAGLKKREIAARLNRSENRIGFFIRQIRDQESTTLRAGDIRHRMLTGAWR